MSDKAALKDIGWIIDCISKLQQQDKELLSLIKLASETIEYLQEQIKELKEGARV